MVFVWFKNNFARILELHIIVYCKYYVLLLCQLFYCPTFLTVLVLRPSRSRSVRNCSPITVICCSGKPHSARNSRQRRWRRNSEMWSVFSISQNNWWCSDMTQIIHLRSWVMTKMTDWFINYNDGLSISTT